MLCANDDYFPLVFLSCSGRVSKQECVEHVARLQGWLQRARRENTYVVSLALDGGDLDTEGRNIMSDGLATMPHCEQERLLGLCVIVRSAMTLRVLTALKWVLSGAIRHMHPVASVDEALAKAAEMFAKKSQTIPNGGSHAFRKFAMARDVRTPNVA